MRVHEALRVGHVVMRRQGEKVGVEAHLVATPRPERVTSRFSNGRCADLEGDRGNDRLIGGLGFDVAEGGPGSDLCSAEIHHGC